MKISSLKKDALASLRGHWGVAILLGIISFGLYSFIPVIAEIIATGGFSEWFSADNAPVHAQTLSWILSIALSPILYSFYWAMLDMRRGQTVPVGRLFNVFSGPLYLKTVGLYLLTTIYTILWALLLIVPGIIKGIAYSQAYFILKDNPNIVINDAITQSRQLMDGYKGKYFLMTLSFIGWSFLALLTFGIGFIWLAPYFTATLASFYQSLIEEKNMETTQI
ncbi:DUF975 family protein [Neobacillus notoginsengisoli]|uniref:DUF975 family protein n=1 Tax=Neobacillus notoginsengisoli TaxID=1578198 RepID=A0A417YWS7_9BACI|nr:DUF975 family protein [Neobacillus notoginsengisoli]RHW42043.1 DUF975 family protein [Neobacillus notoginsengisoli]